MKEKIIKLIANHHSHHGHMSYFVESLDHKDVVEMGQKAVGPLFEILQESPKTVHFILNALSEITGEQPPGWDDSYRGKMNAIRDLYLQWGQEQGYIEPVERTNLSKDDILVSNEALEDLISVAETCLDQGNYEGALLRTLKELKKLHNRSK